MQRAAFRQLPQVARQRGLPAIGFEILPGDLVVSTEPSGVGTRFIERGGDGNVVGELEVTVFAAALVIDADGALEEMASTACGGAAAEPVALPGATGYRAAGRDKSALPCRNVFALAPHDLAVGGGLLVTIRTASPGWPAADALLRSLRILTRRGAAPVNDDV